MTPTRALAGLLLTAAFAPVVHAQREPVLKQIRVPHPYYYREMYLPQATSGPGSPSWSPDGRELIYSMQGSLWLHTLGDTRARQVTNGPGYDFQPDWSPDGRFVAYASYRDDALGLWLLDLASGDSRPLTANHDVNLEPRWSPDGKRIAFVSTAYNQRWHLFVLELADGQPQRLTRLTEDHDSGLPRYYYSGFDHFLSPSWSPDGQEILFVGNRGHIWGSGGFWRMKAEPGAPAREIRYEETTWKARPDWSRQGRRVVYASYLGAQWHQLWLMTAEGGDVFPLTYGDFDATEPRWSPDGRRIAYVSNQGGNTSLWTITVPGGQPEPVTVAERQYLGPVGRLQVRIHDAAGRALPARVSVTGADGRSFAPDDAWRHADEAFDRRERRSEVGYFHSPGESVVTLPAGTVALEVSRGLEYRVVRRSATVTANTATLADITLERIDDLPARGVWSGDLHVHMNYGGAYRNDPKRLVLQAQAEDVHLVENLIVNKEQRVPDIAFFSGRLDGASTPDTLLFHSQEYHTSFWGHVGLLGLRDHLILPGYAAYVNTAAASLYPTNADVMDMAHRQAGVAGYVHPFDADPDPARVDRPLSHELPADVALGKVDYYEVLGFVDDPWANLKVWYRLLNCGFRIPAGAGTDAMANFASLRGPVGLNRVFVKTGGPLDHDSFLAGLKAGRTFASNGPLLQFSLAGKEPGDEINLPDGAHRLEARVAMKSIVPIEHLELVANGRVVASLPVGGDGSQAAATVPLRVVQSGWYTLRAWSQRPISPVLDLFPLATTSPIYVLVGGQPIRSAEDARFFLAWIDRLLAAAQQHQGWNQEAEKEMALSLLAQARAVYQAQAGAQRPGGRPRPVTR